MNSIKTNTEIGLIYKIKNQYGTKGYLYGTCHENSKCDPSFCASKISIRYLNKSLDLTVENNILTHPGLNHLGKTLYEKAGKIKKITETDPEVRSQEAELLIHAVITNKLINELETIEEQETYIKEYTIEKSHAPIFDIPYETWKQQSEEFSILNEIIWKISDEIAIEKYAKHGISASFSKKFYDERNIKMAEKIDKILGKEGRHFIAIGSGHVIGNAGVVNLLRSKGWNIEKID